MGFREGMTGMLKMRYQVCELFGIPIYIDISLAFLLLFFVTGAGSLFIGLAGALMLAFSITLHELGHALTARAFGYGTRDITLSLLGGCASLIALPRKAWQEFWTAIAGPLVSFALALAGAGIIAAAAVEGGLGDAVALVFGDVLRSFGVGVTWGGGVMFRREDAWLVEAAFYLATMNAMLGIFNLLPGFPMDGGRVFRSAMRSVMSKAQATRIAMIVGRVVAAGLGLVGLYRLANGRSWGVVTMLIAWMIWKEGWREYRLALAEEDFRSWTQDDFNARVSPPPYGR